MVYQFAFTDKPVCRQWVGAAGLPSGPLARAVDDPALSDEILAAASTAYGTRSTGMTAAKSKVPVTD